MKRKYLIPLTAATSGGCNPIVFNASGDWEMTKWEYDSSSDFDDISGSLEIDGGSKAEMQIAFDSYSLELEGEAEDWTLDNPDFRLRMNGIFDLNDGSGSYDAGLDLDCTVSATPRANQDNAEIECEGKFTVDSYSLDLVAEFDKD